MRAYKEGDEKGILELWKAVLPEKKYDQERWLRWWRWMYKDNPAGTGKIRLAEHNSQIVGQYAIVPVVMKISDITVLGSQSIDTITHPDYRRQKIFETLAKEVFNEARKHGIHVVYGFPGEFSYPGFIKKLGWFNISVMRFEFKPLDWENALKLRINNRFLLKLCAIGGNLVSKTVYKTRKKPTIEGLMITKVTSFDQRIDELWARVSNRHKIMVVRNKDYLNWRYVAVPDVNYVIYLAEKAREVYGYLVLRCEDRNQTKVGIIFDIQAQSEEIARCLISKAIEHCKQERVDLIHAHIIANKALLKAFRKNGFLRMPFLKGTRFCGYSNSPNISKEFLKVRKNWLVLMGDSDTL